ncbi:DUF3857 domain-containing protein [Hymenobacter antarcticus]|uniref:DUF3857 domain-containing protein n=1 Tax=Hymenobacter antarcticus TaxID=486270 RepID=A0ABP7QT37_9BACT
MLGAWTAQAQVLPIKFGKIDPADLTAAPFVQDSAAAVLLCDYASSRIETPSQGGLQMLFERTARIKILKKSGFEWATVEVPLYASSDKLSGLKGFTYNLVNGVMVKEKLENDGKYTDDLTKHIWIRKFTMPNVREGSVIEFSYTVVSENFVDMRDWQFQHSIPVRWSEYRITYPEFFDYRTVMQGYLPLKVNERTEGSMLTGGPVAARTWNYRWAMQNVPAFVDEPFITTAQDYVSRLNLELSSVNFPNSVSKDFTSTWEKIDDMLLESEHFGLQLDRGGFLKEALAKLPAASVATQQARVAAVHALVRDAVKYNDNDGVSTTTTLRKTYQDVHRGSSADINLLLIAALRTAGIEANPVLLSTRDHGHLNIAFPLLSKFNYVVAHVLLTDGQDFLLDATEPLLPAGTLPERCLNQVGRLVMKNTAKSRWLDISPSQRRVHYQQAQLTLALQGTLSGKVHEEYGGYSAATVRQELGKLGEPKYRSQFAGRHSSWTLPKFAISARDELSKPVVMDYEFSQAGDDSPAAAGTFYLSLLDEFGTAQNPFRHGTRAFPVDFGMGQEEVIVITLNLPEGYELAEMPRPAVVDLPENGGRYLYMVNSTGPTVQLTSRLTLRKPVYGAEEYEYLREFYRVMLEKQAEKLVVKKKA